MGISQAARSPTVVHRSFKVTRTHRRDVNQIRHLWWWGRRRQDWWSSDQEDVEERLRRHQALMMHRYSKAMRRRSLWERDTSSSYSAWNNRACRLEREMSSSQPLRAKVEERETKNRTERQAWQEFHKDFDSFKRAVDRAIERDPYGTLFGRRLRSPETPNNSSWTSWSWIFDPKDIKKEPEPEQEEVQKTSARPEQKNVKPLESSSAPSKSESSQPSVIHSSSSSKTTTRVQSSQSIVFQDHSSLAGQYVYDPVSGRKVLQPSPSNPSLQHSSTSNMTDKAPEPAKTVFKTGFLQSIFGEHGTDIPVKTYKPPKVYGYTGESRPTPKADQPNDKKMPGLENSRKREYDSLRARTLGNNIDATNFNCEPWNNKKPEVPNVAAAEPSRMRTSPAPREDAPLFSGTTYASKSEEPSNPKSDWLAEEGFRAKQDMNVPASKHDTVSQFQQQPATKMQPALDRTKTATTNIHVKKFDSKLQPAMDRIISASKIESVGRESSPSLDKREDVDLLRPSDVRAATKSSRVTKQEVEEKKRIERSQLEKDYVTRRQAEQESTSTADQPFASLSSVSNGLGNIWKHIKDYPQGIVAKTMQNIGLIKDESTQAANKSDTTVRRADAEAKKFTSLGSDLKTIYEQECGKIEDVNQVKTEAAKGPAPKFSEPTVKPGVVRDFDIERHTRVFEPKIASIVDKAKAVKQELHDARLTIGDVVNERAVAAIASRDIILQEKRPTSVATTDVKKTVSESTATLASNVNETVSPTVIYGSPFILLAYNKTVGDVTVTPLSNLMGRAPESEAKTNPMAAIGSLNNPNAFVKHFVDLDTYGYELASGGGDVLIFQKRSATPSKEKNSSASSSLASTSELRSTIAAAEAAAQPGSIETATVLDEIPPSIPVPGPAAPTAPTSTKTPKHPAEPSTVIPLASISKPTKTQPSLTSSSPDSQPIQAPPPPPAPEAEASISSSSRKSRPRSRVSRQEQVFSGQVRLPTQTTALPDPEHFQKQNPTTTFHSEQQQSYSSSDSQPGFFARLSRAIKRITLTAIAFGVGAYGIGVVAEGINAKAQIEGAGVGGPMKRLVLADGEGKKDRTRSGIYSTENSR